MSRIKAEDRLGEIRRLKQQLATTERLLAESQAREPYGWFIDAEHEDIFIRNDGSGFDIQPDWVPLFTMAHHSDSTALDAAIAKAKREENEVCEGICNRFAGREMHPAECAAAIRMRRMADKLKGGEQ